MLDQLCGDTIMELAFLALKTDPSLIEKINRAASHKPTPSEVFEQRVSGAFAALPKDSSVTRERVRQVL